MRPACLGATTSHTNTESNDIRQTDVKPDERGALFPSGSKLAKIGQDKSAIRARPEILHGGCEPDSRRSRILHGARHLHSAANKQERHRERHEKIAQLNGGLIGGTKSREAKHAVIAAESRRTWWDVPGARPGGARSAHMKRKDCTRSDPTSDELTLLMAPEIEWRPTQNIPSKHVISASRHGARQSSRAREHLQEHTNS